MKNHSTSILTAIFFVLLSLNGSASVLNSALADSVHMLQVKSSIRDGKSDYSACYKKLIRQADKLLSYKTPSVIEKEQFPASNDKHDFLSLGPYNWPDPSKADGLPYIYRDGERNPEASSIPDDRNFNTVLRNIFTLSLSYYFSENSKYADKAREIIQVWFLDPATAMNPNMNYAQAVKGKNSGTKSGIIQSRNIIYLCESLRLLDGNDNFRTVTAPAIRKWIGDFLNWMQTSKPGMAEAVSKNNHSTFYDVQIVAMAKSLGKDDVMKSFETKFREKISSQIEPDGGQPLELKRTKSFGYSLFNLLAFSTIASELRKVNDKLVFCESNGGSSLKKAAEYLLPFVNKQKPWTYQQIAEMEWRDGKTAYLLLFQLTGDIRYFEAAENLDENKLEDAAEMLYICGYPGRQ